MSAPAQIYQAKNKWTMTITAAAGTVTLDMPVPSAPTLCWVIDSILVYCLGTVTAFDVDVTTSVAGDIARAGGQVGGATNGSLPAHIPIPGPIVCDRGDQTKVILTATGATAVQLTLNAHEENAN